MMILPIMTILVTIMIITYNDDTNIPFLIITPAHPLLRPVHLLRVSISEGLTQANS